MKEKLKNNKYFMAGLTLFLSIGASILLYFLFLRFNYILSFLLKIAKILSPILLGLLFAYLLNPIANYFEKKFSQYVFPRFFKTKKDNKKINRIVSMFITYLIVGLFVILFIEFVIPNLLSSIQIMINNIPIYINNVYEYLKNMFRNNPDLTIPIDKLNMNITEYVTNIMVPSVDTIMANIANSITGFINGVVNVAIGLVVSIYLIYDKENFINGAKKVFKVILPKDTYNASLKLLLYTDKVFGGFMYAKVIDSLIIGLITFLLTSIFNIPYALIISIIIGLTNIIPYFGPIIGTVPCALLLFMIDPTKCLTFIIIVFLIQQFDGNILGPRLIGNKTGLKSFWVLFAILLFGGLFGFVGMIFGVPIFAIIYSFIKTLVDKKLELKESK